MKKNMLQRLSIVVVMIIIIMSGAYSIIGPVLGQESETTAGNGEHRTKSSEGSREVSSESSGEHSGSGGEGRESGSGGDAGERAGSNVLARDQTYDVTRNSLRLILGYDAPNNRFVGQVENSAEALLTRVRVEIHLSNGLELGPTTPADLAAGQVLDIELDATAQSFDYWTPHAEVGKSEGASEGGDPSSPILALDETWDGIVNGLRTAMTFDATLGAFAGFVENPGNQTLCFVQIELNLKQGNATVVELGPQPLGGLAPGARMPVELLVADEPLAAGVIFDGWEIHPEVFDCGGPGPVKTEGAGEHGGRGGEGNEGSAGDAAEGSGANALDPEQIYDVTRNGARLVMRYDDANNRFVGEVVNKTDATLTRTRVEIHLSNGVELGPTTPTDLPPGQLLTVIIPSTAQPFDTWTPHAEFGMGEGGKSAGEHGGREGGGESAGEHRRREDGG